MHPAKELIGVEMDAKGKAGCKWTGTLTAAELDARIIEYLVLIVD
jgi:hypothetical protein